MSDTVVFKVGGIGQGPLGPYAFASRPALQASVTAVRKAAGEKPLEALDELGMDALGTQGARDIKDGIAALDNVQHTAGKLKELLEFKRDNLLNPIQERAWNKEAGALAGELNRQLKAPELKKLGALDENLMALSNLSVGMGPRPDGEALRNYYQIKTGDRDTLDKSIAFVGDLKKAAKAGAEFLKQILTDLGENATPEAIARYAKEHLLQQGRTAFVAQLLAQTTPGMMLALRGYGGVSPGQGQLLQIA